MRKRRSAARLTVVLSGLALAGGGLVLKGVATAGEAPAPDPFPSRLDARPGPDELARHERADDRAARTARDFERSATRDEPVPPGSAAVAPPQPEPDVAAAAEPPAAVGGDGGGGDAPSDEELAMLRRCESGGDYTVDTGNGYYGGYQFAAETWWAMGYPGYPNEAAAEVQDDAVRHLHARSGWYPWPGCARSFGWI